MRIDMRMSETIKHLLIKLLGYKINKVKKLLIITLRPVRYKHKKFLNL